MSQLTIRKATVSDSSEIVQLVNEAYRPYPGTGGWTHESNLVAGERTSTKQVEEQLRHSVILVGLCDAKIMACVQIEDKGEVAHIGMLAVKPTMQGAGIGHEMLTQAEKYANSTLDAKQFVLIVVGARTELIQFYLRRGYEITQQRLPYPLDSGVGRPLNPGLYLAVLRKYS